MLADAGLVSVALALAVGIRLLYLIAFEAPLEDAGEYVRRDVGHFLVSCPFLVLICLASFWISGFYTYSSNYLSRYKAHGGNAGRHDWLCAVRVLVVLRDGSTADFEGCLGIGLVAHGRAAGRGSCLERRMEETRHSRERAADSPQAR